MSPMDRMLRLWWGPAAFQHCSLRKPGTRVLLESPSSSSCPGQAVQPTFWALVSRYHVPVTVWNPPGLHVHWGLPEAPVLTPDASRQHKSSLSSGPSGLNAQPPPWMALDTLCAEIEHPASGFGLSLSLESLGGLVRKIMLSSLAP